MITRTRAIKKHREIWEKLAKSGNVGKPKITATNDCWLCEYVVKVRGRCCPLEWPETHPRILGSYCTASYFTDWLRAVTRRDKRKWAKKIATLEEVDFEANKG